MRFNVGSAALAGAALATTANAVNPLIIQNQEFVDSITQNRYDLVGIDYQPGGSAGFTGGKDPLSDGDACLRDATLMQQLGINAIRVYNLDPTVNHDLCASIFNAAGIYMMLDVNSPFDGGNINQDQPKQSYNTEYVNRTFLMIDAFRMYPNLIGFFGANELINTQQNAGPNAPYIRAVQRDMKQYMSARGGRPLYVGYSAAQVQEVLVPTSNYLQCAINGDADGDISRADYFALNSYSWCGQSSFQTAGYDKLVNWFQNSTIPVFFSEYGCNKVTPRPFTEIPVIYGPQMAAFSGGLVYQWTQDTNNYGVVQVNDDGSVTLLQDYDTLKTQFGKVNQDVTTKKNDTATTVQPAACDPSLVFNGMSSNWNLPAQPSGVQQLITNGVNGQVGKIITVTDNSVKQAVTGTDGQPVQGLTLNQISATNPQVPNQSSSGGSKGSKSGSSSSAAMANVKIPEFGMAMGALVTVLAFAGLY